MVDPMKVALRLLPAVRPIIGRTTSCGACSRVSRARIHSASEQSLVSVSKFQPQVIISEKTRCQAGALGIVRFARAVFAYVGAGLSAVTANQFAGPSIFQAKELGSGVGGTQTIGTREVRGMWQRPIKCHIVHEDPIRSPKFNHCPRPHTAASKSQDDICHPAGHYYHWKNSWGPEDIRFPSDSKLNSHWQISPSRTNGDGRYSIRGGSLDNSQSGRFSMPAGLQVLAVEGSHSLKPKSELVGTVSNYSKAAERERERERERELELEWQFIVDSKPKSAALGDHALEEEVNFKEIEAKIEEEAFGWNSKQDDLHQVENMESRASKIMTKSMDSTSVKSGRENVTEVKEEVVVPSPSLLDEGDINGQQKRYRKPWPEVLQSSFDHPDIGLGPPSGTGHLGRIAQKHPDYNYLAERMLSTSRTSLSSIDIEKSVEKEEGIFRSLEGDLLAEILHGTEPTRLGNSGLLSSAFPLGSSDLITVEAMRCQMVSGTRNAADPRPSTHVVQKIRTDNGNTSCKGGGASRTTANPSPELLGEALCHSQTRARKAEKEAQEAYEEKERLVRLLFRETSRSLTYRQWATSLEAENLWLRNCTPNQPHQNHVSHFSPVEEMHGSQCYSFGKIHAFQQIEDSSLLDKDPVVLPSNTHNITLDYTMGIAFALGLGLAGAGLMLGWGMGWIFIAYSVSV